MDMSLCSSLAFNTRDPTTNKGLPKALTIYDVNCQYYKNFVKRYEHSVILKEVYSGYIPLMEWAIGKLHLGVHIPECYGPFSLNHMKGTGQISGETMEPLWSLLNGYSRNARVMSMGYREEFLLKAMNGINWKSTTGLGKPLINAHML